MGCPLPVSPPHSVPYPHSPPAGLCSHPKVGVRGHSSPQTSRQPTQTEIKRFAEGCGCLAGSTPKPPSPQTLWGLLLGPLHAKGMRGTIWRGTVGGGGRGGRKGLGDGPSSLCSLPGIPGKWPQLIFIFTFPRFPCWELYIGKRGQLGFPQLSILRLFLCPIYHLQWHRTPVGLPGRWGLV